LLAEEDEAACGIGMYSSEEEEEELEELIEVAASPPAAKKVRREASMQEDEQPTTAATADTATVALLAGPSLLPRSEAQAAIEQQTAAASTAGAITSRPSKAGTSSTRKAGKRTLGTVLSSNVNMGVTTRLTRAKKGRRAAAGKENIMVR
jgi:hypothetical protein